ncbi:hypothetical protein, partial [Corallococcus sp. 4LFB]|uniref:hypothetical protein n=1 Tax=Corallococcus sp. 4LFB TaxID=3383249 RepID=UPI003975CB64
MNGSAPMDVVVIGAGPAGLLAALRAGDLAPGPPWSPATRSAAWRPTTDRFREDAGASGAVAP